MSGASNEPTLQYVVPSDPNDEYRKSHATTGASAAGVRAISVQLMAFYFRTPIKAFFRSRVDYMALARALNPGLQAGSRWSWRTTTPGLLANAIRHYAGSSAGTGARFPTLNTVYWPRYVLKIVSVGAILYTSYLQALGMIYAPSSHNVKRLNPPPSPLATFAAGASAGALQSVVAAPLDALQTRFNTNSMLQGEYSNMWQYARSKLREIGVRGVMAGWSLSLVKDSLGYGMFFAAFETVKTQAYYSFLTQYYGYYKPILTGPQGDALLRTADNRPIIKPHYAVEPTFLLLAGIAASVSQQAVQHPISTIQEVHYSRLESLDYAAKQEHSHRRMLGMYYRAYQQTYEQCKIQATRAGSWRNYLYKSFWKTTIGQVPSTAAGLVVFELVRRKYAIEDEVVRIQKDGFDIVLS